MCLGTRRGDLGTHPLTTLIYSLYCSPVGADHWAVFYGECSADGLPPLQTYFDTPKGLQHCRSCGFVRTLG